MADTMPPRFPLDAEWFDAIARRVSRRRFDKRPVSTTCLNRLEERCDELSQAAGSTRAVLVRETPHDVFTGFIGSYGKISGAPSLVAFVGEDDASAGVGYLGEAVILDATLAGLSTCWIGGSFDAKSAGSVADLARGERVFAVTPIGHATEEFGTAERLAHAVIKSRSRLALGEIAPGNESWPSWAREAAEAVRLAPSGVNRQPWRLRVEDDALVLGESPKPYWTAPIDFGIAMLHAELGALHSGVVGRWEAASGTDVARFRAEARP